MPRPDAKDVVELEVGDLVVVALTCSFNRVVGRVTEVADGLIELRHPRLGYLGDYFVDTWMDHKQGLIWAGFIERKASQKDIDLIDRNHLCDVFEGMKWLDWSKLTLEQLRTISDMVGCSSVG